MQDNSIVILGNGGAALYAARAARLAGHRGEVHLVSDTSECAFNPMLSPYYFRGKVSWENCFPFGADYYREQEIIPHCGVPVASLDATDQQVTLTDGQRIAYDRCLIATGASPVLPPVPGLRESSRAMPLRSAGSARQMEEAMQTARRVLIMGASLVGIEMAEVLIKRGIDVVLLDVVDQILQRGTHPLVAAILMKYIQNQGVEVRLGCSMKKLEETRDGVTCHFADDDIEEVDFVVCSTGVRSNIDFVNRDEVKIDLGVLTDDRMRTSVENLYAAGDASQAYNRVTGQHDWLGTWGNACNQGRTAGQGMAGHEAFFPGSLPENISPLFEWNFAQIGDIQPKTGEVRHLTCGDPEQGGYSLLAFSDGFLTGANLINCTHLAGKLSGAILRKWRCESVIGRANDDFTEAVVEEILNECTAN
jgi:assimilatory nitrate reductase electron transfer subunit/3-phenylpropionate/trans-cinnamate dioxygenase ferredoxin reductase subunit